MVYEAIKLGIELTLAQEVCTKTTELESKKESLEVDI